jgi:hypothetical protein
MLTDASSSNQENTLRTGKTDTNHSRLLKPTTMASSRQGPQKATRSIQPEDDIQGW